MGTDDTTNKGNESESTQYDNQSNKNENESTNENQTTNENNESIDSDDVKIRQCKQYQKCCVPYCTEQGSDRCFRRLPACPPLNLSMSSDKVRKTYAVKEFKQKE